jgi:hypothetical protein
MGYLLKMAIYSGFSHEKRWIFPSFFGMFTTGKSQHQQSSQQVPAGIPAGFPRSWYDNEWGYSNRISDTQRGTDEGNGMGWGPGDGALGMDETNVILLKSAG